MGELSVGDAIRVLLLEDSALDAELIELQLKAARLPFTMDRVWTLETFQAAIREHRHDVILSDHLLRGFDGNDALEVARTDAPEVPFIFVSGTLSDELAVESLKRGARDYVVKQRLPRLPDAILRALRENEERKKLAQVESDLQQSLARLEQLANALPALIAHFGLDHRYRFANDAHAHWFGIGPDALVGMPVSEVFGAATFEAIRADLARVIRGQRVVLEVALTTHQDGTVRYAQIDGVPEADASGEVVGYYMLARDITELKHAELSLRETNGSLEREVRARTDELEGSQSRLAAIFESSFQLQILLDPAGRILDANAASLNAILLGKDDVVGQRLADSPWFARVEWARATIRQAIADASQGRASKHEMELDLPTGMRFFDVSLRPLRDGAGTPDAIVVEAVETTARRQAEHALRQSQKIEAIGQLTGGIAHDFNNILTIIAGSAELAKMLVGTPGSTDRAVRALDNALKGVASAASLTHRLLAFARRQPLKTQAIDCNRQLLDMQDMLKRTLGELVQLRMMPSPALWSVEVDPAQLEASILNLAVNARDAMPSGGELVIETSNTHLSGADADRLPGLEPGDYVLVRVRDTGEGMSAETMSRVFEPFFTTKEVGRGTGLGLPMVYGFVKQSNGHVLLESTVGVGTSFTMFFPRSAQVVAAEEEGVRRSSGRNDRDATILVAEDNDDVRAYVVEVLRDLGYRVLEAHDGHAALRLLGRPDVEIDLLFSDVVMPGMAGWELAQRARQMKPELTVLFTSGYPRNIETNEKELRGTGILAKPFTRTELSDAVERSLDAAARSKEATRAGG
ncbi:PAS domain-containing protein [Luteibacter sp. PPL201]|uniref:histidine kinase n=1 Tax=Luteibacter sahnii TaxID=3021977 RepID=A0ABT6BC21_9GAMM